MTCSFEKLYVSWTSLVKVKSDANEAPAIKVDGTLRVSKKVKQESAIRGLMPFNAVAIWPVPITPTAAG